MGTCLEFFIQKVCQCFQTLFKSKIISYYIGLLWMGVYGFKMKLLDCWNKLELVDGTVASAK